MTVSFWTPLVGETLTHDAVGSMDHFSAAFPLFEMSKVCDGKGVPALPCTLMVVGDTESCAWANTETGSISATATSVSNRTADRRISLSNPCRAVSLLMMRWGDRAVARSILPLFPLDSCVEKATAQQIDQ